MLLMTVKGRRIKLKKLGLLHSQRNNSALILLTEVFVPCSVLSPTDKKNNELINKAHVTIQWFDYGASSDKITFFG